MPFNEIQAYHLDYCKFINSPYEETPHYAFITDIKWLSANSTRLIIELDIWNECQFDMVLNTAWVERTHVSVKDDIIGKYTYPEGLETGEMICANDSYRVPTSEQSRNKSIVFATTFNENFEITPVGVYQGSYNGLSYIVFPLDVPSDIERLNTWIQGVFEKNLTEGIVNAYIVPTEFATGLLKEYTITFNKPHGKFGGYKPKCNKCYTYPFQYLVATDNMGNVIEYHYEDFYESTNGTSLSDQCIFVYLVSTTGEPSLFMHPRYYKHVFNGCMYGLTFNNFTKVAIATDTYKMWLAQNSALLNAQKVDIGLDAAGGILKSLTGGLNGGSILGGLLNFGGGIIDTAKNTASSVMDYLAQKEYHKTVAPGMTGVQSNGLISAIDLDHINFYFMQCKEEYIGKIDSFFWCYGYSIGDLMGLEIIKSRKYWNYIKTVGCDITGNLPLDMLAKLRALFDKGMTIWHTNDIGNYNLDNNEVI